jgi:hypothetical protein
VHRAGAREQADRHSDAAGDARPPVARVHGDGGARRAGPREERRSRDDGDERGDAAHAEQSAGERFAEDGHPRGDRQRVRPERGEPGRRERPAALEPELQCDERDPVADEQRRDEPEVEPTGDRRFRPDVARGVEDPGRRPESGGGAGPGGHRCCGGRDEHPDRGVAQIRVMRAGDRPRERNGEEGEPRDRRRDREPLSPRAHARQCGEDREPAGRARLDERQRRERQRDDVQHPAGDAGTEARQPAAVAEQRGERAQWVPQGERRERRGDAVLGEVAPVERRGRREREHEAAGDRPAHSCSRLPKGRYASAASAAMPTRGRSSRFS